MPQTRIVVAADTGPHVGLGHLGRCTAIAEGLVEVSGEKAVFFVHDPIATSWLANRGFETTSILPKKIPLLIADSYHSSASTWTDYRQRARRLLVMDDFGDVRTSPDWIVNSSPFAHRYAYQKVRAHSLMLGPLFHPLRREFWPKKAAKPIARSLKNVLVILGGGDTGLYLSKILRAVRAALAHVKMHAVVGPYTKVTDEAADVIIHRSPKNLRAVMEKCELAVSAAGQTLFELAACGIPTLAIQFVANQTPNYTGFRDLNTVLAIGSIDEPDLDAKLRRSLRKIHEDAAFRRKLAATALDVVDGRGAYRIAQAIRYF